MNKINKTIKNRNKIIAKYLVLYNLLNPQKQ